MEQSQVGKVKAFLCIFLCADSMWDTDEEDPTAFSFPNSPQAY